MASAAGSSSGGSFDTEAILGIVEATIRDVATSWDGEYRVSTEGRAAILNFAGGFLTSLDARNLPSEIDNAVLGEQAELLTRGFLQEVRRDARATGTLIPTADGNHMLPPALIANGLAPFVAARCACWPQ